MKALPFSVNQKETLGAVLFLALAFVLTAVFFISAGANPYSAIWLLISGGGTAYSLTEAISKTLPIALCAFAVAIPGKLGLINIGGEGQFLAGAIGASAVVSLTSSLPAPWLLISMGFAGIFLGVVWGGIPGLLKSATGASEIVTSLIMNYLAAFFLLYLINGPFQDPLSKGWPQGHLFPDAARMSGIGGSRVSPVLLLLPVIAFALSWFFLKTKNGFRSRIIGSSLNFSRYLGISVPLYIFVAMAIAGAFAGFAGIVEVTTVHGRLREGISLGYGYSGFFVAWLCGNRFWACLPMAFIFALFATGADALQLETGLPISSLFVFQGVLFLVFLIYQSFKKRLNP